eukprot:4991951-Pyramimonas_sp.AAC.1
MPGMCFSGGAFSRGATMSMFRFALVCAACCEHPLLANICRDVGGRIQHTTQLLTTMALKNTARMNCLLPKCHTEAELVVLLRMINLQRPHQQSPQLNIGRKLKRLV